MTALKLEVKGEKELMRALNRLPGSLMNKVVSKSQGKASTFLAREMRRRAPVRDGHLRRSIGKRKKTFSKLVSFTAVGVRSTYRSTIKIGKKTYPVVPHNYAHLIEFGHARVKRGTLKVAPSARRGDLGRLVKQKGTGEQYATALPRPFIRPALAKRFEARSVFVASARPLLDRAVKDARR